MPLSTATRSNLPSSVSVIIMIRSGSRSRSWLWIRGSLHVRLRKGHWLPGVQGVLGVLNSILLLLVRLLVVAAFGFPLLGIGNPKRGSLVGYRLAVEALQNNNGIGDVEEVAKGESSRFEGVLLPDKADVLHRRYWRYGKAERILVRVLL